MSGLISSIQESSVAIIKSDSYFQRVTVIGEQIGDIKNQIDLAIGKLGLCAIVTAPDLSNAFPDTPGPYFDPINVWVDIVELVITNRGKSGTGLPCSDVAEHVAAVLHSPNFPTRNDQFCMVAKRLRLIPNKDFLIYRVELKTAGGLDVTLKETE